MRFFMVPGDSAWSCQGVNVAALKVHRAQFFIAQRIELISELAQYPGTVGLGGIAAVAVARAEAHR